jgi:predicted DNA-binding transcriptional regulator AlpA
MRFGAKEGRRRDMGQAPMTPDAAIDMAEAAALCGLSYERFRRVWATLPGFPRPFKQPLAGHGTYAWVRAHVLDWREARARTLAVAPQAAPAPANDHRDAQRAHQAAVARERAVLGRLFSGAR